MCLHVANQHCPNYLILLFLFLIYRGSSIYNRILGTISGYLNRAKDKAKKMIGPVVKRLDVRKKLYNYAAQKLRNIRKYFNRKKSAFVSAENRMNHLRRRVDTICSIRKVRTSKSI